MTEIVANFEIPYTAILNPEGQPIAPLPKIVNNSEIMGYLYRNMVLIRTFDKKAIALQRTGKLGTYAPKIGQEAIATIIGYLMQKEDVFIPYYRDYACQIQRGVRFSEILAFWGGDERGNHFQYNSHDLPMCVPIASQCLHAAGVAFAFKYRKQPRVAVVCIGDGGTSEGDFYEAMNVAGCWKLPLIIVINNNQWAISVSREQQTASQTLAQKAIAAGFQGLQVDGNDILALHEVFSSALEHARGGKGPILIEAISYRLSDHTTADDASRYQNKEEVEKAWLNEPMLRFKKFLETHHQWNETKELELITECKKIVDEEVEVYLTTPRQPISSMFDFHYEKLPEYLILQRAIAIEEGSDA